MAKKICCICGKEFNGYGNNPEPVFSIENENGERNYCCDWCNLNVVINARLYISELIRDAQYNSKPEDLDDVLSTPIVHSDELDEYEAEADAPGVHFFASSSKKSFWRHTLTKMLDRMDRDDPNRSELENLLGRVEDAEDDDVMLADIEATLEKLNNY